MSKSKKSQKAKKSDKKVKKLMNKFVGKITFTNGTKYKMVPESNGLYRIIALKDFGNVKEGDVGGLIENPENLSQDGHCWIGQDASVVGNSVVHDDAQVYGFARISQFVLIGNNAKVYDSASLHGNISIYDNAQVFGNVNISGRCYVRHNAKVYDSAEVVNSSIIGNAKVFDCAVILNATIDDDAKVFDEHHIKFGYCNKDLSNLADSIRCQTGLAVMNGEIICYKRVRKDLTSFHDCSFKYVVGEWAEAENPQMDNSSCAPGLHFSHATYWDCSISYRKTNSHVLLMCKVLLEDVITCQEGKIRAKKCFVIGICQ